jgi:hypothetical protein
MTTQASEQSGMPRSGNFTNGPQYLLAWQDSQEPQTDDRIGNKSRQTKIHIASGKDVIEPRNSLMDLGTNATGKKVAEWRDFAKEKSRPILQDAVSLRQRSKYDVGFLHEP